jgi:hypothetical protein
MAAMTVLEGTIWRFQLGALALLGAILILLGIALAASSRDWTAWVGVALMVGLVGLIVFRAYQQRRVVLDEDETTFKSFWRTRVFRWSEIANIDVFEYSYGHPYIFYTPILFIAGGENCAIPALRTRSSPQAEAWVAKLRFARRQAIQRSPG